MIVAPIAIAILIGLVAGALRRGRLISLTKARLRLPGLLGVAVLCALGADVLDLPIPSVLAFVGLLAGIAFAGRNLLIPGMAVIGIGLAANLVPVALNGAMPVRADALVDAGIVAEADLDRVELRGARELADSDTMLEVLGDVIPLPLFDQVLSFGDLIVLVGLADVIANLMRARRPPRLPQGAAATLIALGWDVPPSDDIFIDLRESIDAARVDAQLDLRILPPNDAPPPDPEPAPSWDNVPASSSVDRS